MCCYFVLLTLLPGTFRSLAQHLRRAIKANTHWVTVITGESGITDGGDEPEGGEEETPEVDEEEDDDEEEEAEEDDDEGGEEEEEVAQPQQKRPAAAVPMVANVLFNI